MIIEGHADTEKRFWDKVEKREPDQCWKWKGAVASHGYGSMAISLMAHRVAWGIAHGSVPTKNIHVLHKCDDPLCVNPSHLFLGSHQDNMLDKEAKGRGNHPFGSNHGRAKLTENLVKEIWKDRQNGKSQRFLARKYGVARSGIRQILRGISWKHVKSPSHI
jgi:hypothetical protein